ncbi:MAG: recombinase family protein [Clostridiales bacterium]|nr:recombinase family protein [Clostridiales bacterium]
MAKTYGYARCSLAEEKGQDINRQVRELKAAGAEEIVLEREHGDAKVKQNLEMLLDAAEAGDTIITTEVSRLSRSTQQLCEIINVVKAKKLRLVILGSITVDCRNGQIDPMSQAFVQMSGIFAELELSILRARVRSGMENAREKGKHIGRPQTTKDDIPAVFYKHYPAYMAGKLNVSELARVCGLSRPTVYKYLKMVG